MNNGQPWRRFYEDSKNKKETVLVDSQILATKKIEDDAKVEKDLRVELQRLCRSLKEDAKRRENQQPQVD